MDRLEEIFALQAALDNDITERRNLLGISYEEWMQKDVLAMISELGELLDEVNFKWWKNPKPLNKAAIKEELVDILHFFISMCLRSGMDADELHKIYVAKNQENFDRQNGKSSKKGYSLEEEQHF